MPPVIILGSGPAGLFAAQAVDSMGGEPQIFSVKKKSELVGPQFLHQRIPGLSEGTDWREVDVYRLGTPEGYIRRVYGDSATPSQWYEKEHWKLQAWNMQAAYDRAWDKFESRIVNQKLDARDVEEMTAYFPIVISTIPLWSICKGEHTFESVSVLVVNDVVRKSLYGDIKNYIIYNGSDDHGWYRTSYIFGKAITETVATDRTHSLFREHNDVVAGFKIVGHDCDCHPNLIRAGRMGTWRRGVLTHHAYDVAVEAYGEAMLGMK